MENKEVALQFLGLVVTGKIDEAFERYVNMGGKHHNTFSPTGMAGLMQSMKDSHAQFPSKQLTVKQLITDEDRVVVHSHLLISPDQAPGMVAVHILRFEDFKIVEIWDCGQPIPADSPNSDGAF